MYSQPNRRQELSGIVFQKNPFPYRFLHLGYSNRHDSNSSTEFQNERLQRLWLPEMLLGGLVQKLANPPRDKFGRLRRNGRQILNKIRSKASLKLRRGL